MAVLIVALGRPSPGYSFILFHFTRNVKKFIYENRPHYRYSRRIMRLEVGTSNKDPKIVCGYYIKCVQQIGGKL